MQERLDDLLHTAWEAGQIKNSEFGFLLRMESAGRRKWIRRMQMIFGGNESSQSEIKGAVIPKRTATIERFEQARLQRQGLIPKESTGV